MMMFEYYVDAVDADGNVTICMFDYELGDDFQFNGRDISAVLKNAYNYGHIQGFKLHEGAAPKSAYDWDYQDSKFWEELKQEAEAQGKKPFIGFGITPPSDNRNINHGRYTWMTIDELLAQDWQRLVPDIRELPDWHNAPDPDLGQKEKAAFQEFLSKAPLKTIEDFVGEDVLEKLRALKDKGFTRFTCWIN